MIDKVEAIGFLILTILIISVSGYVFYATQLEPWQISNEIKNKIKILSPYDDYSYFFCYPDYDGWWNADVIVFDIQNGTSASSFLHYNRNTGIVYNSFNNSIHGIEILGVDG